MPFDGRNHQDGQLVYPYAYSPGAPLTGVCLGESLRNHYVYARNFHSSVFDVVSGVDYQDLSSLDSHTKGATTYFRWAQGRRDLPQHATHLVCHFTAFVLDLDGADRIDRELIARLVVTDGTGTDTGSAVTLVVPPDSFEVVRKSVLVGERISKRYHGGVVNASGTRFTVKNFEGHLASATGTCEVALSNVDPAATATTTDSLTYNSVVGGYDTITRSTGSFLTDGFRDGMRIGVSGTVSNNSVFKIAKAEALTLSLILGHTLTNEGPVSSTVDGTPPVRVTAYLEGYCKYGAGPTAVDCAPLLASCWTEVRD